MDSLPNYDAWLEGPYYDEPEDDDDTRYAGLCGECERNPCRCEDYDD